MEQNKVTKALEAMQNWGWFIGIVVFLGLIAIISICQAIDDFQWWKYLSAAWWFFVFYGASSVILYLVTDKVKSVCSSQKTSQHENDGSTEE